MDDFFLRALVTAWDIFKAVAWAALYGGCFTLSAIAVAEIWWRRVWEPRINRVKKLVDEDLATLASEDGNIKRRELRELKKYIEKSLVIPMKAEFKAQAEKQVTLNQHNARLVQVETALIDLVEEIKILNKLHERPTNGAD